MCLKGLMRSSNETYDASLTRGDVVYADSERLFLLERFGPSFTRFKTKFPLFPNIGCEEKLIKLIIKGLRTRFCER